MTGGKFVKSAFMGEQGDWLPRGPMGLWERRAKDGLAYRFNLSRVEVDFFGVKAKVVRNNKINKYSTYLSDNICRSRLAILG